MMQTTFFDAAEPPQLDSEQQLLLFTLLLNVRREIFAEQLGEEPARDTACFDLFNAYLRSGAATQLEMLHRFSDLCAETCRQREENETHSTQAIIKRDRYDALPIWPSSSGSTFILRTTWKTMTFP